MSSSPPPFPQSFEDKPACLLIQQRASHCDAVSGPANATPVKILRAWPDTQDEEELTAELVRNFGALDGAPEDILKAVDADELAEGRDSALELAIISDAKHFCSQPLIQHLAGDIYSGKIVYHPPSTNSFISDNYVSPKTRRRRDQQRSPSRRGSVDSDFDADAAEVYSYNPYLAGWLDYTRLRVPRWRQLLEFLSFFGLVVLFVLVLASELPGLAPR